jgi:hypothetical protein
VLVSRGLVESKSGSKEFGLERAREVLAAVTITDADEICRAMLAAVQEHSARHSYFGPHLQIPGFSSEPTQNDSTAIALVRHAAAAAKAV